ncbi:phosphoribosyl-AMP cyclohydrolase [Cellulomonas fimi]|uniref:phosphoribosyl-AMP cyclohydrolase n=1 Tax=Cellulomonas fimi TaxID=1708 RepID=UPI003C6C12C0
MPRENPSSTLLDPQVARRLRRDEHGLVAAVVQQHETREVLMVGWMDDEALHRTLTTGRVTFWSRSRQEYWRKGDTSGHAQYVKAVSLDCDGDALLVEVDQVGAACHTGTRTCFEAGGPLAVVVGHRPAAAPAPAPAAAPAAATPAPAAATPAPAPAPEGDA